ncbi:hypothetical protein P7K49_039480 [Saguinus oedipus]|uniref:Uncharacterized protein n=1 Tax=Saguinus oedipus TaxID=9490 RepID=A0ABQ9TCH9_SAGOE|nr:hypothetical protein P7K49_039480 [Saguinus oedipus]
MPYSFKLPRNEWAHIYVPVHSASVSLSTWGRQVSRSAMPAGNCTALNMEFSPMVRCQVIKPSVAGMTPSTRSSVRLGLASMCPEQCLWTWSPPWSVGALALDGSFPGRVGEHW